MMAAATLPSVSPHLASLLNADAADPEGNDIVCNDGSDISDDDGNNIVSPHLATMLTADAADQEGDGNDR